MARMRRSIEKEQFWRRMLAEQRRSGLEVRAFCRAKAVSEPSFYSWRRVLQSRDAEAHLEKTAADAGPGRLIPVTVLRSSARDRVKSPHDAQPTAATKTRSRPRAKPPEDARPPHLARALGSAGAHPPDGARRPLEIGTPGGFTLRFDSDASSETISRVLDILARCEAKGTSSC